MIDRSERVADIVCAHPQAARVFHELGLDFFCRGGGRTLEEACREAGLDPEDVAARIAARGDEARDGEARWDREPVAKLVDHLLFAYHEPLKADLARIEEAFERAREEEPPHWEDLHRTFRALRIELEQHLMKEEQILFPMIRSGQGHMADGPILVMRHEHDDAAAAIARIAEWTGGFRPPPEAGEATKALWAALDRFCEELKRHMHLENHALFPRVE